VIWYTICVIQSAEFVYGKGFLCLVQCFSAVRESVFSAYFYVAPVFMLGSVLEKVLFMQ